MIRLLHVTAQKPEKTGSGIFVSSIISEASVEGYFQGLIAGISIEDDLETLKKINIDCFYPACFDTEELPFPVVGMSDVMPYESTKYSELDGEKLFMWESAFAVQIDEAINRFKPDVIITHHLWLLSSLVCRMASGIPIVCVCHGTDLRQMELCPELGEYVSESLSNVDLVLALTEYQIDKINKYYGISKDKIQVIGGAYNDQVFSFDCATRLTKKQNREIKIVYAGKLSMSKGVSSLIKAYNELEDDAIELIIAGSGTGSEKENIEKQASLCKNKITFLGPIDQLELAKLYNNADIFVLPSFYEGLPLVVIEALATGLRVVVSELPGLKEWLGNDICSTGIIEFVKLPTMKSVDVPNDDDLFNFEQRLTASIKHKIDEIRNGEQLPYSKIQDILKQYSWKEMFLKIEKHFNEVIS